MLQLRCLEGISRTIPKSVSRFEEFPFSWCAPKELRAAVRVFFHLPFSRLTEPRSLKMRLAMYSLARRSVNFLRRHLQTISCPARPPASTSRAVPSNRISSGFQLELDAELHVSVGARAFGCERGVQPVPMGSDGRMALPLNCYDFISSHEVLVDSETTLHVSLNVPRATTGQIQLSCSGGGAKLNESIILAVILLDEVEGDLTATVSLSGLSLGTAIVQVTRLPDGSGIAYLQSLRVSTPYTSGRVNALSAYDFRMRNEISNFSGDAYSHQMYGVQSRERGYAFTRSAPATVSSDIEQIREAIRQRIARRLADIAPEEGEVAFNYAMRALGLLLPHQPPDFFSRAKELSERRSLKILSILSGAARVEEQILAHCGSHKDITLIDASRDLLERAATRLRAAYPDAQIECLVGDINKGLPGAGCFDIIICVSALHHVANLELVLSQINARLADDGEFWSIGEQIGRNGNRLWPDSLKAANEAFARLPERLRRNSHTGLIDSCLTDRDFSIGCFEGVRSEELNDLLEAYLIPDFIYKRNSFLWRLVDATYGDNFDLSRNEDLEHMRALVAAEVEHWMEGGRSTELHGIYRKKLVPRGMN